MIPIRCHACGLGFRRTAAQVLAEGCCPKCASSDIDVDDAIRSRRTASQGWWSDGVVGKQLLGFPGSVITDVEPTETYLGYGPSSNVAETPDFIITVRLYDGREVRIARQYGWLKAQQDRPGATVTAASAIEEASAPLNPSTDVASVTETARCSSCMAEFSYEATAANAPVPACTRCGSSATSPAGATGVGAKQAAIARDILASNPGMTASQADAIARETLRRFPRVAGRR